MKEEIETGCIPETPPRAQLKEEIETGCIPETPPRAQLKEEIETGCIPETPPRTQIKNTRNTTLKQEVRHRIQKSIKKINLLEKELDLETTSEIDYTTLADVKKRKNDLKNELFKEINLLEKELDLETTSEIDYTTLADVKKRKNDLKNKLFKQINRLEKEVDTKITCKQLIAGIRQVKINNKFGYINQEFFKNEIDNFESEDDLKSEAFSLTICVHGRRRNQCKECDPLILLFKKKKNIVKNIPGLIFSLFMTVNGDKKKVLSLMDGKKHLVKILQVLKGERIDEAISFFNVNNINNLFCLETFLEGNKKHKKEILKKQVEFFEVINKFLNMSLKKEDMTVEEKFIFNEYNKIYSFFLKNADIGKGDSTYKEFYRCLGIKIPSVFFDEHI